MSYLFKYFMQQNALEEWMKIFAFHRSALHVHREIIYFFPKYYNNKNVLTKNSYKISKIHGYGFCYMNRITIIVLFCDVLCYVFKCI